MKSVGPTVVPIREFGRSPGDLDQMLRAFFQQELPKSWPAFAGELATGIRQPGVSAVNSKWSLFRSRMALAASITLILVSTWWLGGRFAATESPMATSGPGKVIGAKERQTRRAAPRIVPDKPAKESTNNNKH
jgi:hypothetical protein